MRKYEIAAKCSDSRQSLVNNVQGTGRRGERSADPVTLIRTDGTKYPDARTERVQVRKRQLGRGTCKGGLQNNSSHSPGRGSPALPPPGGAENRKQSVAEYEAA